MLDRLFGTLQLSHKGVNSAFLSNLVHFSFFFFFVFQEFLFFFFFGGFGIFVMALCRVARQRQINQALSGRGAQHHVQGLAGPSR